MLSLYKLMLSKAVLTGNLMVSRMSSGRTPEHGGLFEGGKRYQSLGNTGRIVIGASCGHSHKAEIWLRGTYFDNLNLLTLGDAQFLGACCGEITYHPRHF